METSREMNLNPALGTERPWRNDEWMQRREAAANRGAGFIPLRRDKFLNGCGAGETE